MNIGDTYIRYDPCRSRVRVTDVTHDRIILRDQSTVIFNGSKSLFARCVELGQFEEEVDVLD